MAKLQDLRELGLVEQLAPEVPSAPSPDLVPINVSLWPVRCRGCGRLLGHKQTEYENLIRNGTSISSAMDMIGISPDRFCCRSEIMGVPEQYVYPITGRGYDVDESALSVLASQRREALAKGMIPLNVSGVAPRVRASEPSRPKAPSRPTPRRVGAIKRGTRVIQAPRRVGGAKR